VKSTPYGAPTGDVKRKLFFDMDSQGRSRLIIGGLSLAAVILVISLLLTQQSQRLPVVESPLASVPASVSTNEPAAEETPAQQAQSPLAVPGPESPLANPGNTSSASAVVTNTAATTDSSRTITSTVAITTPAALTETAPVTSSGISSVTSSVSVSNSAPVTTAMAVSAVSTVTVSLAAPQAAHYGYEVVASYPHDPEAYTEGLQYVDGVLYEGVGLYGHSGLRRVDLESGVIEKEVNLAEQYFGEGIYVLGDRIYQLTWKSNIGFIYDRESFELVDQFSYPTEGWGLTYDGQDLIMSDGSPTIFRRDPKTFAEVGRFTVVDGSDPVNLLNELEYIDGSLWANIWLTDQIVIIDPASGQVTGRVDLTGLLPSDVAQNAEVLNGIAFDEANDRIFVTGKLWPLLFEIKLVPQ
jgi:glutamine cyclotransferase